MKKIFAILSAVLATFALNSCISDMGNQPETPKKSTHKLVVNASADPESKVAIEAIPGTGGYEVNWQSGDCIQLFECAPAVEEYYWNAVRDYFSSELQDIDISNGKASFTFEIEDRPGEGAEYMYLAYYGQGAYAMYEEWTYTEDEMYQWWAQLFDYSGEYMEPHMLLSFNIPSDQSPGPDSFDSWSDIMISEPITSSEQLSGEAQFKFGRLGAIVKITVKGLEEFCGEQILDGNFMWGESYEVYNQVTYDPVLNKYAYNKDGETDWHLEHIAFYPQDVTVKEDGTFDLWLKMPAGVIDDWFRLEFYVGDVNLARTVNLADLGKSLILEDGQMTVFSVSDFDLAIVEEVYGISYSVNEAKDGFIATWDAVEHADGYECMLVNSENTMEVVLNPVDNGDGTWSASVSNGMEADIYRLLIKPIPSEGYALIYEDYASHDIYIGIPDSWWLAHAAFSDDGEQIEGSDESIIEDYMLVPIKFKNLETYWDATWNTLKAKGEWYFYNTESLNEIQALEVWSKNDSHEKFNVYASLTPGGETVLLTGEVIEVSEINAGNSSYGYSATHKRVRYTFPTDQKYGYFSVKGESSEVVLTSQFSYIYYFN